MILKLGRVIRISA